jgi:hypothetical protein
MYQTKLNKMYLNLTKRAGVCLVLQNEQDVFTSATHQISGQVEGTPHAMSWTPAQRRPRRHSTMTLELRAQTPTEEEPPTQPPPVVPTAHHITPKPAPGRPPTRSTTQPSGESIPKNQKPPKKKTKTPHNLRASNLRARNSTKLPTSSCGLPQPP